MGLFSCFRRANNTTRVAPIDLQPESDAVTPTVPCRIATLNVQNLSIAAGNEKLQWIADEIARCGAYIVAVQEVSGRPGIEAVSKIEELLNRPTASGTLPSITARFGNNAPWGAVHNAQPMNLTQMVNRNGDRVGVPAEHCAFFYRTAFVEPVGNPHTFTEADKSRLLGRPMEEDRLLRSPVFARFIVRRGGAGSANVATDVTLLSYHFNVEYALRDCSMILACIDGIRAANPDSTRHIVVLGDFNLGCGDLAFNAFKRAGYVPTLPADQATNIAGNLQFDNIWVHEDAVRPPPPVAHTRPLGRVPGRRGRPRYWTDHRMVVADLEFWEGTGETLNFNPPNMSAAEGRPIQPRPDLVKPAEPAAVWTPWLILPCCFGRQYFFGMKRGSVG